MKEWKPEELRENPFSLIGKTWMLVTAEKDGKVNTMTASWGGVGILWGKEVAFVFIRPQRYTKEFVDNATTLSLTFLDESFRKTLGYLGSVSGRDEDKIAKSGLTVAHEGETPYFAQGRLVVFGRKLFAQPFDPKCFQDPSLDGAFYPQKDYHTMYVVEIQKILTKEEE